MINTNDLMEAYMIQREKAEPYFVYDIINEIEKHKLNINPNKPFFLSVSDHLNDHIEIHVRQNIICYGRKHIFEEILRALSFPNEQRAIGIPSAWRKILTKKGFNIDKRKSQIKWIKIICTFFVKGFVKFFKLGLCIDSYNLSQKSPHAVLMSLHNQAWPQNEETAPYTFTQWVYDKNLLCKNVDKVIAILQAEAPRQTFKNFETAQSPFPKIDIFRRCKFFLSAAVACLNAFWGCVFGQWWRAISLEGVVEDLYFQQLRNDEIAKNYVFNTSSFRVRPLWTHTAEDRGALISVCFYSASAMRFYKNQIKTAPPTAGFKIMTWQKYWVPDLHFKDFLVETCGINSKKIESVGPVDFCDSGEKMPEIPSNSIAVFDVSAYDPIHFARNHMIVTYPTVEIVCEFLNDVYNVLDELGIYMVLKTKRLNNPNMHQNYIEAVDALKAKDNVMVLENGASARRVAECVNLAIALPFTSAALFSGGKAYQTIYYDPTNNFIDRVREAHGISVVGTKEELKTWLLSNFEKQDSYKQA